MDLDLGQQERLCGCGFGSTQFLETPQGRVCSLCGGLVSGGNRATGAARRARSVLLVEGNPEFRDSLQQLLSMGGHQIRAVADGYAAVAEVGRLLRQELSYDLVLLDLELPEPTGLQVLRLLRALDPKVPVVMLSESRPEQDLLVELKRRGASRLLSKRGSRVWETLLRFLEELDD